MTLTVDPTGTARSPGASYQDLLDRDSRPVPDVLRWEAPAYFGDEDKPVALPTPNGRIVGLAQPGCRVDQRIEHGRQVEGRPADDLEHVGSSGLLLEGFA